MPFKAETLDLIFNRRGPSFYAEYYRLLKVGGHYVEIGIGEKDAKALIGIGLSTLFESKDD